MIHGLGSQRLIPETLGQWETLLAEYVHEFLANDFTGHDLYHCLRVRRLALHIAENENLDRDVMAATAYLHDIGRSMERIGHGNHVPIGMERAREILPQVNFTATKIDQVVTCIEYHEDYAPGLVDRIGNQVICREVSGFQDADRLDAIGAIGIARAFAFGGANQIPMWTPEAPGEKWVHGKYSSSSYSHLNEKLLKLRDVMNTETGQKLAESRHRYVEHFVEEFDRELYDIVQTSADGNLME